jgi:lipopolysaccharide export system permease protein
VGRPNTPGYQIPQAALYVLLLVPSHLYELFPITVLIGTIYVMTRLAQSSEFTILRTSGLGPWRALRSLLGLGAAFFALTFAVGDYLAPVADRQAQLLKARYLGNLTVGQTGAWLKERHADGSVSVNVASLGGDGRMAGVRIFDFDVQGRLRAITRAERGNFEAEGWRLDGVTRRQFTQAPQAGQAMRDAAPVATNGGWLWSTRISADMVTAALLKPDRMKTIDLFQYIRHLNANGQSAQRYAIEFWRKVFYPMSCIVMVVLALPFAYLHFRSSGITGHVFGGVMLGISFFLLNNVFGFIGNLREWQPWLTAAAPGLLYMLASLTAFGWLVLRR